MKKGAKGTLILAPILAKKTAEQDSPEQTSSFDSQLSSGDRHGAVSKLQNDIRKDLDQWLVDGYAVSSSLQYTKVQVLDLTDELIERLSSN